MKKKKKEERDYMVTCKLTLSTEVKDKILSEKWAKTL